MIRFSPRAKALRQLGALRRLATSSNEAEARSARLKADRVQRRHRITEEELEQSNADASHAATIEGWDAPWQVTLLGTLGDHAGVTVSCDVPATGQPGPGRARVRGPCAGLVAREARVLAADVQRQIEDPALLLELGSATVTIVTQTPSIRIQQTLPLSMCLGADAVEVYAMALVFRGAARVAEKLKAGAEALAKLDAEETRRAECAVGAPTTPPPEPPLAGADGGNSPPPPDLALANFVARVGRVKILAAQFLGTPDFASSVDRRVDPALWDACGTRLAGEEDEALPALRGLLIDQQHGLAPARADRRGLVLQVCEDLAAATRRPWHPIERDPDGAQTADGMQRISIGPICLLIEPTGVRPLGVAEGEAGWRARLVEAVRAAS